MPKQREKSSDEWYKSEIRNLKKQVKQLQQQLKYHEKRAYGADQDSDVGTDNEDTYPDIKEIKKYCSDCGKGQLRTFELIGRVFEECNVCKYRKKISG